MVKRPAASLQETALKKKTLKVASDCTGLNAAAMALETLRVPFEEDWGSDTSRAARKILEENFNIKTLCENAKDAPALKAVGHLDIYTAGFPCPSFSRLGKKQGLQCEAGQVMLLVLKNIAAARPRILLLENVSDLMTSHEKAFDLLLKILKSLKDSKGERYYKVIHVSVLNSLHHGVPQSRGRLYIAAVHNPTREFLWPMPRPAVSLKKVCWSPSVQDSSQSTRPPRQNSRICWMLLASCGKLGTASSAMPWWTSAQASRVVLPLPTTTFHAC